MSRHMPASKIGLNLVEAEKTLCVTPYLTSSLEASKTQRMHSMSFAASRGASSPANKEFKTRLGQAIDLKNQERYDEAAQILEELRETNPQSASVHAILGHVLWEQDDLARAVPSFKRAVTLSPESELASLGFFHTLMESEDKRGAIEEMNRFLRGAASKEYDAVAEEFGIAPQLAPPS